MGFLYEFEGKKGERLVIDVLKYLLTNERRVRDSFLQLVSSKSDRPLSQSNAYFGCFSEYETDSSGHKQNDGLENTKGRVDLVLISDDVVIGLEIKFYAAFQAGQPGKYISTMKDVARAIESITKGGSGNGSVRVILCVLCPKSRAKEVEETLKSLRQEEEEQGVEILCLYWSEDICKNFEEIKDASNIENKLLLEDFLDYVNRQEGFVENFEVKCPHYRKIFPPKGSPEQRELVGCLWSVFPNGGPRLGGGSTWTGYYLLDKSDNRIGWYGFVDVEELNNYSSGGAQTNKAELVVVSTVPNIELSPQDFTKVELHNGWLGRTVNELHAWVINFDKGWNTRQIWSEKLMPLRDGHANL